MRRSGDRLNVEGVVQKFPDKFWGIGPDTPAQNEEDYTPFEFGIRVGYQWNLSRGFFLGPLYAFSLIDMKTVEEGGLLDGGGVKGGEGARASGAGIRFTANRRDNPFFPRRGFLIDTSVVVYSRILGSADDFSQFRLDYRHFFPLFKRHVFGIQYVLDLSTGDVPFQYMPKLGGRSMMRGYYEGRYRDLNYTALQGEYRLPLFWRLGMVAFGSVGHVAPDVPGLLSTEYLRAAGGLGLRFLVEEQRKVNFRVDVAFTGQDTAVYFNVLEAF
jgi:outer membrane protein assembly factor BamA